MLEVCCYSPAKREGFIIRSPKGSLKLPNDCSHHIDRSRRPVDVAAVEREDEKADEREGQGATDNDCDDQNKGDARFPIDLLSPLCNCQHSRAVCLEFDTISWKLSSQSIGKHFHVQ